MKENALMYKEIEERMERLNKEIPRITIPNKYITKTLKQTLERNREVKETEEAEELKIKQRAKKMEDYAKLVKQMHWPEVSPKKREEMKKLRNSVEYKKGLKKSRFSARDLHHGTDTEKMSAKHKHTKSQAKIDWKKFHNPMIPKEQPKRTPIITDYLLERRVKRDNKEFDDMMDDPKTPTNPALDWKSVLNMAYNNKEYSGIVREKAKVIESNAMMKRKTALITDDIEGETKANDMLIDALEAKLSILDKI